MHRERLMKIILGPGWRDQTVAELVAAHPELRQISLQELLHRAHHMQEGSLSQSNMPETGVTGAAQQTSKSSSQDKATPLAIEAPKPGLSAEDWIKQHLNEYAPEN